jgi:uncharacterized protein
MKYLLDVNALIALGFEHHQFHVRVAAWVRSEKFPPFLTCSITELGFVRVLAQTPKYGCTVSQALDILLQLKNSSELSIAFISDANDISCLPSWVKTPGQTTDGHLAQLALANDAVLATFDQGIQGAFLIP